MSSSKQVPQFLTKLYKLTNSPTHQDCLAWSEDGSSFWVSDIGKFSSEVLPSYYKHNNYASFVRQLNMYGFHRSTDSKGKATPGASMVERFEHPYFKFGREDLLIHIQRKPSTQKKRPSSRAKSDTDSSRGDSDDRVLRLERQVNLLNVQTQNLIQQHTRLQESVVYIIRLLNHFNITESAIPNSSFQPWAKDPNLGDQQNISNPGLQQQQHQQGPFNAFMPTGPQQFQPQQHQQQLHQAQPQPNLHHQLPTMSAFDTHQNQFQSQFSAQQMTQQTSATQAKPMESDLHVYVDDDDVETMDLDAMLATFAADHTSDIVPVQ